MKPKDNIALFALKKVKNIFNRLGKKIKQKKVSKTCYKQKKDRANIMKSKRDFALFVLKEAENALTRLQMISQKKDFETYFEQRKGWANIALETSSKLTLEMNKLFNNYRHAAISTLANKPEFFNNNSKENITFENSVVPEIRNGLDKVDSAFKKELANLYHKYLGREYLQNAFNLTLEGSSDFNRIDEVINNFIEIKSNNFADYVAGSIKKSIEKQFINGCRNNLSKTNIIINIRDDNCFSNDDIKSISQAEVINSSNYAEYCRFCVSDNVIGYEWSANGDKNTRVTHLAANGQKRAKGQPFDIGISKLFFPCDTSLGATFSEVARCRCTLKPIMRGESLESKTVYDQRNVHTTKWLRGQTREFREAYLGSKHKTDLFNHAIIDQNDFKTPWANLKRRFIANGQINLGKTNFIGNKNLYDKVKEASLETLNWGLDNNKELMIVLNTNGDIVYKKKGEEMSVGSDKNIFNIIDTSPDNSLIFIHNHPNDLTLSDGDIATLLKYNSIGCIVAIGHKGTVFAGMKSESTIVLEDSVKNELKYITKKAINYEELEKQYGIGNPELRNITSLRVEQFLKRMNVKYYEEG